MTRSKCPVIDATGGHVDDSVFVGKEGNEVWETARKQIHDHHHWKMWESVILNWPGRIKTQPHDDRDNCFLHYDSKGPLRYDSEQ